MSAFVMALASCLRHWGLAQLGSEALRERDRHALRDAIDLGVRERAIGSLKHQSKREADATLRHSPSLVAIEDLDGDEIRSPDLPDLFCQRSSRLRPIDEHGQIAAYRR